MNIASLIRLISLSAIWGASFLFMRIGAPVLGPVVLIEFRVGLAAIFLLIVGYFIKKSLHIRVNWRHYFILGLFNSALPFLLFAIAAKTLSASLLSILNATAPIWGAVIAAVWSRTPLTSKGIVGLALGVIGVGVLVGFDSLAMNDGVYWAIFLALGAAFSYGVATTYAKTAKKVDPFSNAHGSMWAATLMIAPAVPAFAHGFTPSLLIIGSVLALGVLCSGVAYLLYFKLIADIGPTPALTVTFLIPVFGVIWGHLFLDEPIGTKTLVGACIVIVGTAMVTGFSFSSFRSKVASKTTPQLFDKGEGI
jgi:drug/metabolite transporter (DMT)-like permease